jgi:penicillin-binding protein 2
MAGATDPTMGGTAAASHLEGVDFAGKTGTAQVASHEAIKALGGGKEFLPNGWFVGVIPRKNPEFVVAVLWEHGDWGSNAARLAAQVATVYVNKQRMEDCKKGVQNCSLMAGAGLPAPVQMGAVWSAPEPASRQQRNAANGVPQLAQLHAGHFPLPTASQSPALSSIQLPIPAQLGAPSLRRSSVARVGNHEPKPVSVPGPTSSSQPVLVPAAGLGRGQ